MNDVEICNLALGHLGQDANITSIDPPELSFEALLCARFYPLARDVLLESADWTFAMREEVPARVASDRPTWSYAFRVPENCLRVVKLRQVGFTHSPMQPEIDTDDPWQVEADRLGNPTIYTHVGNPFVRYVSRDTPASTWSPLFIQALTWKLAAMLAGPIYKGEIGRDEAKRCEEMLTLYMRRAVSSNVGQSNVRLYRMPPWISRR